MGMRCCALLIVLFAITGCRALPAGAGPSGEGDQPPSSLGEGPESSFGDAPLECGFPQGAALEYAGRSTTAELDVQEVVGDPMSTEPADIYITRDKFDQGEHHGRLVCAVFVDQPGFVEVTVHPEDGGRFVEPTPAPSIPAPEGGLTEAEAVDIARATLPEPDTWEFAAAEAGPMERMMAYEDQEWAAGLPGDLWVWRVFFFRGDEGVDVVLDYLNGTVLGTAEYIVN